MKKIAVIILIPILFSCGAVKVNVTDDYISNVVSMYSKPLPKYSEDYSVFWDYIIENNEPLKKYSSDESKFNKKVNKEFWEDLNSLPITAGYSKEDIQKGEEYAKILVGDKYTNRVKSIIPNFDNIVNAYAYPNGYVFIHGGIMDLFDEEWHAYRGVAAHEIAHVLLQHAERHNIESKKKERNEDIARGITAGLLGVGAIAGSISMANSGVDGSLVENWTESYVNNAKEFGSAMSYELAKHSLIKKYEYSREQEIEADIVAVLFLKWIGRPVEPFIDVISKSPMKEVSLYDSHPNVKFRVSFLNKLIGKPNKSFEVGGLRYNVDGRQVEDFLRKNPTAKEVIN